MSAYFCHALGFFLQIGPCALLSFLPFLPSRTRPAAAAQEGARWRIICGAESACAALALAFPPALRAGSTVLPLAACANLSMLFAIALLVFAYLRLVREPLVKKLVVLCLVTFYALTQYVAVNAALPFVEKGYGEAVYSFEGTVAWAVSTLIMLPFAIWAFSRGIRDYVNEIDPANMQREFALVLLASLVYFGIVIYYSSAASLHNMDEWKTYGIPCLFAFFMMLLFYWLIFRESVRRKRDNDYQRLLEIEDVQHKAIMADVSKTRRMRHDMRHHLSALSDMLESGEVSRAQGYIADMIERTAQSERVSFCENPVINALLSHYVGQARDAGVACEVSAACSEADAEGIEPVDLTVIMGNALENAILACTAIEHEDERWIHVRVGVVSGAVVVQIENACANVRWARGITGAGVSEGAGAGASAGAGDRAGAGEPMMWPAKAFMSTRSSTYGCGLASIEHAARKYGGSASFGYSEHTRTFTTRVLLNPHTKPARPKASTRSTARKQA